MSKSPVGRRRFLGQLTSGASALIAGPSIVAGAAASATQLSGCGGDSGPPVAPIPSAGDLTRHGALQAADANGLRLPDGFTSRIIATSRQPVGDTDHNWHSAPDGGATFPTDGGYIYVSNAELQIMRRGGVGAIRFDYDGNILDAYPILTQSFWNCSGGPTPWGTWLSGEEHDGGLVWECDPEGVEEAVSLPALGINRHEAVAVDPDRMKLYLTEDISDGRLYRFTPASMLSPTRPDLTSGTLEALRVTSGEVGAVTWETVPDPSAATTPTREQVPLTTAFDGGEGIWFQDDEVYFTTKGDNRIWALHVANDTLRIVYDAADFSEPVLTGVDFILATAGGDLVVGEDGGDMQVVAVSPDGTVAPLVQVEGHDGSEITGIAFDPWLQRMYFSSQRGLTASGVGVTFEVSGPFFGPLG